MTNDESKAKRCVAVFRGSNRDRSPKFQIPSSRETSNNKLQSDRARGILMLGAWCFSGAWSLELGVLAPILPRNTGRRHPSLSRSCRFVHARLPVSGSARPLAVRAASGAREVSGRELALRGHH